MIFVDLSQTIIAVLMQNMKGDYSLPLARAMVYQTLISYKKKFGSKYGEIVLAQDKRAPGIKTWRKAKYPWYKASRNDKFKDPKEAAKWEKIFECANQLNEEFEEFLTWKIVGVPGAEADDVIAVLASVFGGHEPTLIVSSDGDYPQLQKLHKVDQWSATQKKFIKVPDAREYLHMKILTGDLGDGIPNILSVNNSFTDKIRQKPVTKSISEEWRTFPSAMQNKYSERYKENRELIDFEYIPENIQKDILSAYDTAPVHGIQGLYKFFIAAKMVRILEDIELFKVKPGAYSNATQIHSDGDFFDGGDF